MQIQGIRKALNIPEYKITKIISWDKKEIHLQLEPYNRKAGICSHCGLRHYQKHSDSKPVIVEDLSMAGLRLYLHVIKRKYECKQDSRVHVEKVDWIKPWARVTKRFAKQVSQLTAITTNTEAGWFLGLDDEVVYRIDKAALEDQAKTKLEPIPAGIHLSVDEVSYCKYHRYMTNVIDTDRKLIIWNAKGRKSEILDKYYQGIGPENCGKIESVAMDGARTFISSTTKYAINALIVYDKFHLFQKLNNTVDTVRKIELQKARSQKGSTALIDMLSCNQRFILLKNKQNLSDKQSNLLAQLCDLNQPIYEAMLLKESFISIYAPGNKDTDIEEYLLEWMIQAYYSQLQPFKELATKLYEKLGYILNWFKQKVSSAISEGFNNKIKRLKRMAYGYKDIDYFRLKIHQHCGLLNPRFST